MFVATAEDMRALDRETIQEVGVPSVVLMENAGRGAACLISHLYPDVASRRVAVICGKGNNGGDGFVIARCLIQQGAQVEVYLAAPQDQISGDARVSLEILQHLGFSIQQVPADLKSPEREIPWSSCSLIIDALMGTGIHSKVRGIYRRLIEDMNRSGADIVAVDMPSGLSADHGKPLGVAVEADVTITFGLPKVGQFLYPGRTLCGDLWVVDIGIPHQVIESKAFPYRLITPQAIKGLIGRRSEEAHKGHFGHVLVLAGSVGKTGAGVMASEAALRVGAGLVTMGLPRSLNSAMEARLTEVMTLPLSETAHQSLARDAMGEIVGALEGKTCVALGPGVSTRGETPELVRELVLRIPLPMVVDADGLNALCGHLDALQKAPAPRILTPHPGEMGRLLNRNVREIQEDRLGSALTLAAQTGAYVTLKGAGSLVASPDGHVGLIPTGNPAMASAGMGDVLTGILAGLIAQGVPPFEAMELGAYLHGWIADEWAAEIGQRGLVATDLLAKIPLSLEKILVGDLARVWPRTREGCPFHV